MKGRWCYLYRAVDKFGNTLDFMLSETRDEEAVTRFFARTIRNNGWPDRVVIDKSGANAAGLGNMNLLHLLSGWCWLIEVLQVKYLNNIIEQDHRFILQPVPVRWSGCNRQQPSRAGSATNRYWAKELS
ncbi:hypothetical protein A3747_11130 [Sulfitobacter sp. HI0076]|nr:hypothetical protein A3720_01665 [Sulfitobacter sp. HI0021]KZY01880.1 hypothetical protein A3722_07390 [Sulfitobacter sp. HI0027]KZZ03553.1 hypothetical protein A3747_11130 [Sulfitobacter sp. HI0076]